MAAEDDRGVQDLEVAKQMELVLLGKNFRVMSCGCVMRILQIYTRPRIYWFQEQRCKQHQLSCPYVGDKVPDD